MKRTLKPTGSRYGGFPKRQRQVVAQQQQSRTRVYNRNRGSMYSAFQKSSGIEKKNIDDTAPKITSGATTWTINVLNDVAQGTTAITRIGRKILMKSLLVQGWVNLSSPTVLRILIIYDRQPNGALPGATDVLTSNTLMAAMNLDNRDRFICLADIFPGDDAENLTGNATNGFGWKRFIKMNLETIYGGNAGSIADINTGSLLIMTNCYGGTASSETGLQRLRFVDE